MRLTLNSMKKILTVLTSIIVMASLSACSLMPSVELTEDEQKVISEYAAGLLLKYDKNYQGSLHNSNEEDSIELVEIQEAKMPVADNEQVKEGTDVNQPDYSEDLTANEIKEGNDIEYSDLSIAEAIGLEGFEIIYKSFETHDIYPEEESEDLVFSMQAQNDMELLVLNFGITNDSDALKTCDILNSDSVFRLLINGEERVNASKTILLNDLSSFNESIEGYAMVDAVLVFEVSKGTASSIENIDLIVKKDGQSTVHMLK